MEHALELVPEAISSGSSDKSDHAEVVDLPENVDVAAARHRPFIPDMADPDQVVRELFAELRPFTAAVTPREPDSSEKPERSERPAAASAPVPQRRTIRESAIRVVLKGVRAVVRTMIKGLAMMKSR